MLLLTGLASLAGCSRDARLAPSPPRYEWPDDFSVRLDFVSSDQRGGQEVGTFTDARRLRFRIRDDESYVMLTDGVLKTRGEPGGRVEALDLSDEDTLAWYVRVGPLGELREIIPVCDPAVASCAAMPRTALALELRRFIPRLSPWPVPRGVRWHDTLALAEPVRGGVSGSFVATYRVTGDTAIGAESYWLVAWVGRVQTFRPTAGVPVALPPVRQDGITLIEKRRLVPVYSTWTGTRVVPPQGFDTVTFATGFRGRAYLVGSYFDTVINRP